MRSMNFVGLSIQVQVEVTEENPGAASNIAPEERPNHPPLEERRVILYTRPRGIVVGKQAGILPSALRTTLGAIEHDFRQVRRNRKEHSKLQGIPDWRADDLMDMGVLLGEVYDEKIIEECLHMGRNPINEMLVNSN